MKIHSLSFMTLLLSLSASHSWANGYESKWTLPVKEIYVCYNLSYKAEKILALETRELVELAKEVINANFTPEKTGVHFVGWGDCETMPAHMALNFIKKARGDFSGMSGYSLPQELSHSGYPTVTIALKESGMLKPFLGLGKRIPSELEKNSIKATILHEFGHVAGLVHEHQIFYKEAMKDKQCTKERRESIEASWFRAPDDVNGSVTTTFPYDSQSVMGYCRLYVIQRDGLKPQLSEGDLKTLKLIYR